MSNQIKYTTKTATLKSIIGDINEINSKKISANEVFVNDVNGKLTSVVELIKDAETSIGSNVETNVEGINSSIESINENISNLQNLVGDTAVSNQISTQISNAIDALDVDESSSNGITWSQADGLVDISINADTAVSSGSENIVTSGAVYTAIAALSGEGGGITALDTRVTTAEGEIDNLQGKMTTLQGADTVAGSVAEAKKAGTDAQAAVTTLANGAVATNASNITELQGLVGTTSVAIQITNSINELNATNIGTGAVKVTQENGVITSVTTDTAAITAGSNLVGKVSSETALVTAKEALAADKIVKDIAESKISSVETDTDYFGSALATTDGTTVTIHPAKEWEIGDKKPVGSIISVINGTASNGSVIDIANLTNGTDMFANNVNLTTFVGNMSKLTNGTRMFSGCTSLATFCGDLSSLTDGTDMFKGCMLDIDSVMYIVDSLPVLAEGETRNITIGVNKELVSANDLAAINTALGGTGWTVVEG